MNARPRPPTLFPTCVAMACMTAQALFAQSSDPLKDQRVARDALYGELATCLLCATISINYEHSLRDEIWIRLGYGVGGVVEFNRGPSWGHGPLFMGVLLLGDNNKFEFGLGGSLIYGDLTRLESYSPSRSHRPHSDWWLLPAASLGYRYQPTDGGFLFRSGLTFDYYGGFPIEISFGHAF